MRSFLIIFVLIFSCFPFVNASDDVHSNDQRLVKYYVDKKNTLNNLKQKELRQSQVWKNFLVSNGEWYVLFNESSQLPRRAFGKPIQIPAFSSIEEVALNFINQYLSEFNIPRNELVLQGVSNSKDYYYVNFKQVYQNLDILDSRLVVKFTKDYKVVMFGLDVFNDISISTMPQLSVDLATDFAAADIIDTITEVEYNGTSILPIPNVDNYQYKLIHQIIISTLDDNNIPAKWLTFIDDSNGQVLYRVNQIRHIDVNVEGEIVVTNLFDPTMLHGLPNLEVTIGGNTYNTDGNGVVTIPFSGNANFELSGLWCDVETNNTIPSFSSQVNDGDIASFDNNSTLQERTAYYHVNIIHDYLKQHYPSFTGLDFALETNIDLTSGSCNAFYSGNSINFYAQGGGCNSLALLPDVVYHEYGHGISYEFYSSQGVNFTNGALGEGNSDIWGFAITENPVLGIGHTNDTTDYIRRYDIDPKVYPEDITGEVHADGEIIAGALWDLGLNLGSVQEMMSLYTQALYGTPNGPDGNEGAVYTDVLIEVLGADDVPSNGGDNDITNGTPNDLAIIDAFQIHGITLISNANIVHSDLESASANSDIDIDVSIYLTYPWALEEAKLLYKVNNDPNWSNLSLNNVSSNNYTAVIPSQPMGTLIAYYLALEDVNGILSGVTPFAANNQDPNLPYFILVGASLIHTDDFDTFQSNDWILGETDDNATTGQWIIDVPVPSYSEPNDPTTMVQTNVDATTGVNNIACALTGNASINDGIGTNDVDDGKTTLVTPPFNLSGYTNPIVTYKRYYTNNPPSGANPGADWWQVLISNDGVSWMYLENTKTSDRRWRRNAFRLNDYLPSSNKVYLKFIASDSTRLGEYLDGGSLIEAAVDDVLIYDESSVDIIEKNIADLNVYPNPTNDFLFLDIEVVLNTESVNYKLLDSNGKILLHKRLKKLTLGRNTIPIDVSNLTDGNYILKIEIGEKLISKQILLIK